MQTGSHSMTHHLDRLNWHLIKDSAEFSALNLSRRMAWWLKSLVKHESFLQMQCVPNQTIISPPPTLSRSSSYIFIIDNWHYYLFKFPRESNISGSFLTFIIQLITKSPLYFPFLLTSFFRPSSSLKISYLIALALDHNLPTNYCQKHY